MLKKLLLAAFGVMILPLASAQAGGEVRIGIGVPFYRPYYHPHYYGPRFGGVFGRATRLCGTAARLFGPGSGVCPTCPGARICAARPSPRVRPASASAREIA
jgi:hypothetical protein